MDIAFTCAAEGFPRRAFTVEDVRRMMDAGVIGENERFELIEGDIVMMASNTIADERIKIILNTAFARIVPQGLFVGVSSTLQLAENILVEPDIAIISRSVYDADPEAFARPQAEDVPLVVEVAVSSMKYDRDIKARLYARHGVREFWLVDANAGVTWIHTGPAGEGWSSVRECGPGEMLRTPALPNLAIRLGEIN